jgi:hypothetical protein
MIHKMSRPGAALSTWAASTSKSWKVRQLVETPGILGHPRLKVITHSIAIRSSVLNAAQEMANELR